MRPLPFAVVLNLLAMQGGEAKGLQMPNRGPELFDCSKRVDSGATGGGFGPPVSLFVDQTASALAGQSPRQWHPIQPTQNANEAPGDEAGIGCRCFGPPRLQESPPFGAAGDGVERVVECEQVVPRAVQTKKPPPPDSL